MQRRPRTGSVGPSLLRRNAIFREVLQEVLEDYRLVWQSLRHPTRPLGRPASRRVLVVLLIWIIVFAFWIMVEHGWITLP